MRDEKSRAKAIKTRMANSAKINVKSLQRRDRFPGEISTRSLAIQNFCRGCLGYEPDPGKSLRQSVDDCQAIHCWLWPYRTSRAPKDVGSRTLDVANDAELSRFGLYPIGDHGSTSEKLKNASEDD